MRRYLWIVGVAAMTASACGDDGDENDKDTTPDPKDTGSEAASADGDVDSEGTDDRDGSVGETACLGSISGQVLKNGETGMPAAVIVCIGPRCLYPVESEPDGTFVWYYPVEAGETCGRHDFTAEPLHIEIMATVDPEMYAGYAYIRHPVQADISDEGDDDFDLDIGAQHLYELSADGVAYDPESGAVVAQDGVSFTLSPKAIVKRVIDSDEPIDHTEEIRVLRAPLDTWSPPFADRALDALYFIAPEWAKIAGDGATLTIDARDGWSDGDEGTVQLLGGYTSDYGDPTVRDRGAAIYRTEDGICLNTDDTEGLERIDDGVFAECGRVKMEDGKLVTTPIPRFTWVGISKD